MNQSIEDFIMNRDEPRLVIFAGAGISAESGVPTFRDVGGLWEGHKIDDVCNIKNFMKNYEMVHDFYNMRRTAMAGIVPNEAHTKCMEWMETYGHHRVCIITTNVDSLFEMAGTGNEYILHVHGSLSQIVMRYDDPDQEYVMDIGDSAFDYTKWLRHNIVAKPGIVMFGECYRYDEHETPKKVPIYESMGRVLGSLSSRDTLVSVGSSGIVVRIQDDTRFTPAHTININLHESDCDGHFKQEFRMGAVDGFKYLDSSGLIAKRMGS